MIQVPAHGRTRGCRGARAAMAGGGGVADPFSPTGVPCAFSPQSQAYFALASTNGHLRVWETANNWLHQEYAPSAHLSGTCTCLAWAPARLQAKEGPQRKKRKSEAIGTSNQVDLLALGTAVGSILLYSTVKGELHSKLIGTRLRALGREDPTCCGATKPVQHNY